MTISKQVLKKIKGNNGLVAKLCLATGKSYPTINRWINVNSEQLTTAACLTVICDTLKLSQEEVLKK